MIDRAWLNWISRQPRIDPEKALKQLRSVERDIALSDLNQKIKTLRTQSLKRDREIREACLFCFGMSRRIGQAVWVYPIEESDFDFIATWEVDKIRHFAPTQLKELVPSRLNTGTTLQTLIDGLAKYKVSEQLTVAIHINRRIEFNPERLIIPKLDIAALWLFGSASEDQSKWFLYGNVLETPSFSTFDYPA